MTGIYHGRGAAATNGPALSAPSEPDRPGLSQAETRVERGVKWAYRCDRIRSALPRAPDGRRLELDQPEFSLGLEPLAGVARWDRDAPAWVWQSGGRWWAQETGGEPRAFGPGDVLCLGGAALRVEEVALDRGSTVDEGRLHPPMVLRILPEHTEVWVTGRKGAVKLRDNAHWILLATARATADAPTAHWTEVAQIAFGARRATEDNWYTNVGRLRDKAKRLGIPELLQIEAGQVRLALRPEVDRLEVMDQG